MLQGQSQPVLGWEYIVVFLRVSMSMLVSLITLVLVDDCFHVVTRDDSFIPNRTDQSRRLEE